MASKRGNYEGTIQKTKSGTYRAQIMIKGRRFSKNFPTTTEARRWLHAKRKEADSGIKDYSDVRLEDYLRTWFEIYEPSVRGKTSINYQRYIEKDLIPHIGETTFKDITPLYIDQYYHFLFTKKGKSASTIKQIHAVLHRALQYAVEKHILPKNPASGATRPKPQHSEKKIWTLDEIQIFLNAAKFFPFEMVYLLALKTGMRQSELFGLKWEDLDWDKETLHVQRQIDRGKKGTWNFGPLKTKAADRVIPLSKNTMKKLKIHRAYVNILPKISRFQWQENNLLLPSERGLPLYQSTVRNQMIKIIQQEKLPFIKFHDLRHTTASLMINAGILIPEVSHLLGHASISLTLDTYTHLIPTMHNNKTDQMDKLLNLAD